MTETRSIEDILREDEALLDGHFLLRSGRHSSRYLQCAKVLQHPAHAEEIARQLGKRLDCGKIDVVLGPATGGIVIAHEMARILKTRAVFSERKDGVFTLRRGFKIGEGERVLVAEDVITTGGAVSETARLAEALGGEVAAIVSIVNRSGGNPFDAPFYYLYEFEAPLWEPSECPLCKEGLAVEKPGSSRGGG